MGANEAVRVAKIGKRTVDAAEAGSDRYIVWDSELKGFGFRVSKQGAKTFIVRYRAGGGRRGVLRQMIIGRLGVLTPEKAREQAERVLAAVTLGEDPQSALTERRAEITVSELCDLYLAEGVATKKASTLRLDRIRIDRHIKPRLGRIKVSEVNRADVQRLMNDIGSGKIKGDATPHTRGGRGAASRTVGLLMGIFNFAMLRGLRPDNPAKGIERFKDVKRDRFLSSAELGRLGQALATLEGQGMHPHHVRIIRLLAQTGARKNEIARVSWPEVDIGRACLRLVDSKTGKKVIHLGASALSLIVDMGPEAKGWVFPDPRDPTLPIRNLDWAWVRVRTLANLQDVRIHDLRHSFASVGLAGGANLALIGKLLGHADVGTTQRYAHLADDPVKTAADWIASEVQGALARAAPSAVIAPWEAANDA